MSVTSSRTPTQQIRRHRYSIMSGTAVAAGVDILLASHTVATSKRGPAYLIARRADWPDTSALGTCNLPAVDGLVRRTNCEPAGTDAADSYSPAQSGMSLTSKVIAKTVSAEHHARAAYRPTKYCEG